MHADGTQRSRASRGRPWAALLTPALALSGCLLQDDYQCSAHQRVSAGALLSCQCEDGYVLGPEGYGCVPCPANSTPTTSGTCACNAGFERASGSTECTAIEGSFPGQPCSETEPCSAPAAYCATSEAQPYCATEGCSKNADCPENWRCRKSGGHAFCAKPPTGLGSACTSQGECAGQEANYCELLAAHVCLPNDCVNNLSVCPSGFSCCDFTAFLGTSLCVVDSFLSGGACPGGATPVKE